MISQRIVNVTKIHPDKLSTVDICTKLHHSPSSGFQDILLKSRNVNLLVMLEKVSRL